MKLNLFIIVVFLGSLISFASASDDFIVKMDISHDHTHSKPLLFLTSGEVIESELSPLEISNIQKALSQKIKVKVWAQGDKNFNSKKRRVMTKFLITKEVSFKARNRDAFSSNKLSSQKSLINENILTARLESTVNRIFNTMRTDTKEDSQCYNRAHVWNWEIHNTFRINGQKPHMGKLWIFFTTRYIREYNYKWWFHIAPFLKTSYSREDLVLDRAFFKGPISQGQWSNYFMTNNAYCPEVYRYSDYEERQSSQYCYHIKTSSHYWQPWHIEQLEDLDRERTVWSDYAIQTAYGNAVR